MSPIPQQRACAAQQFVKVVEPKAVSVRKNKVLGLPVLPNHGLAGVAPGINTHLILLRGANLVAKIWRPTHYFWASEGYDLLKRYCSRCQQIHARDGIRCAYQRRLQIC